MSANNQVVISRGEDNGLYFYDVVLGAEPDLKLRPINDTPYRQLRHVIRAAKDYMQENEVEYGLFIDDSAL